MKREIYPLPTPNYTEKEEETVKKELTARGRKITTSSDDRTAEETNNSPLKFEHNHNPNKSANESPVTGPEASPLRDDEKEPEFA